MSELSSSEVSGWYELLKKIAADFRGAAFRERRERLDRYKALYDATRTAHVGYASLFSDLQGSLLGAASKKDIDKAKRTFLTARTASARDRFLTKHDADTYLRLTDDIAERRFLVSVVVYFCYPIDTHAYGGTLSHLDMMIWTALQDNPDKSWNSASSHLWYLVEDSDDKRAILDTVGHVLNSTAERFALVEQTFSELEGNWRAGKVISKSAVSELFDASLQSRPAQIIDGRDIP